MRRLFWALLLAVSIALTCWIGVSYIDVVTKNQTDNPQYLPGNIFELMVDYCAEKN